ncbi:hypothetical protein NBRC116494_18480 [Aurantivibrio plasticivorans]
MDLTHTTHQHSALEGYDFSSFAGRLKFLHKVLANPQNNINRQSELYLRGGVEMFNCEAGFIASSCGSLYRNALVFNKTEKRFETRLGEIEQTLFDQIYDPCHDLTDSAPVKGAKRGSVAYNSRETLRFLGIPVVLSGSRCGVICFYTSHRFELDPNDLETIELMAEGVARMIDIQNTQEKNRIEDIRGFATPGLKTLEEYVNQARLPEAYGVSGRVIEVLQRRIGEHPLAIDHIAEELNLSKRTLQRRLQQQNVSFAQLRDQVRFHFSIDYLVRNTMSIDAISNALDFSDRTSFTNAFKRWTNLSPSTFRKLFRDYA